MIMTSLEYQSCQNVCSLCRRYFWFSKEKNTMLMILFLLSVSSVLLSSFYCLPHSYSSICSFSTLSFISFSASSLSSPYLWSKILGKFLPSPSTSDHLLLTCIKHKNLVIPYIFIQNFFLLLEINI